MNQNIRNEIVNNPDYIKSAIEISNGIQELKKDILQKFVSKLKHKFSKNSNTRPGASTGRNSFGVVDSYISVYDNTWNNHFVTLYFLRNYHDIVTGVLNNDVQKRDDELRDKLSSPLSGLGIGDRKGLNWILVNSLPDCPSLNIPNDWALIIQEETIDNIFNIINRVINTINDVRDKSIIPSDF